MEEAEAAVRDMMEGHKFGAAGSPVVIEECMTGPEVTVLAFCDGEHLVPMPSCQDHKRAYDGNQGPNTGGMGAICPSPKLHPGDRGAVHEGDLPAHRGRPEGGGPALQGGHSTSA